VIELFLKGGPLMYPLLVCSVLALAIILERGIRFIGMRIRPARLKLFWQTIARRDYELALRELSGRRAAVATILREALEQRDLPAEELERRISLVGSAVLKQLSSYLHLLELIGKIAPMIGLSGTVLGLAGTFQAVAAVRQLTDPGILAGGIWEALITTVAGLFIGIPSLIFCHLYENRLKTLAFDMKMVGEQIVAQLREQ
jgi:biopolymer transport protein ExbB